MEYNYTLFPSFFKENILHSLGSNVYSIIIRESSLNVEFVQGRDMQVNEDDQIVHYVFYPLYVEAGINDQVANDSELLRL